MGVSSVSWTFSDRRSSISGPMSFNRVYRTRVSTHAGARYLVASKLEMRGERIIFNTKGTADVLQRSSYLTFYSGCSHLASLIGTYPPLGGGYV